MAKKKVTRKEDAASIVGDVAAEEIDLKSKATALKSDILIEMSETEEETRALIEEAESQPVEDEPVEDEEDDEDEEGKDKVEKSEAPAEVPAEVEKMDASHLPYGGAISMTEAKKAKEAVEEMSHVMSMWSMLSNVMWNIVDRDDVTDKKAAVVKAVDEFKSMLAAKAMVEFGMTERSESTEPATSVVLSSEPSHGLQPALDSLLSAVDNSVNLEGDLGSKLQFINPTLQELGQAITDYVQAKSVAQVEPPAPNKDNNNLLDDIKQLIQPLSESVQGMSERLGVLEAKSNAQTVETRSRIPQPRSLQIPPNSVMAKKEEPKSETPKLHDIISRSVGIE